MDGGIKLVGVQGDLKRIFDLVSAERVFEMHVSNEEAVAAFCLSEEVEV
jgi:hypothetical protein